ncbi:MAG: hypothetical protein MUD03_07950 [Pirellula sp.]|jgi:hypothetical protein|nr:hypothetical protein [Pirellula sp.]
MRKTFHFYLLGTTLACLLINFVASPGPTHSQDLTAPQPQVNIDRAPASEPTAKPQAKFRGLLVEERVAQLRLQAEMKKQQLDNLESNRQLLRIESSNEEGDLAMAQELAALKIEDLEKRLEAAKIEVHHEEEIYAQLNSQHQALERLKGKTVSNEEIAKSRLELQKQKKALDLAKAKLNVAEVELKSSRVAEQAALVTKGRQLEAFQQRREAVEKQTAACQSEHTQLLHEIAKLAGSETNANAVGAFSIHQLRAMPRDELRILLEKQFDEDRVLIAAEIAELRTRIEKLEKSEQNKLANKDQILDKRLESILNHKD